MNDPINNAPYSIIDEHMQTFSLNRPIIITTNKELVIGLPYLYSEGSHSVAVRLLKAWQDCNIIYLELQELQNPRIFIVSWNLNYEGSYFLWSLADMLFLINLS